MAELLAWISILAVWGAILFLGFFLYDYAYSRYPYIFLRIYFSEGDNARIYMKILAYFVWALSVLYVLFLLCLCLNIRISIAVLKTSAVFLSLNMHSMIVPLISFVLCGVYVIGWLYAFAYVISIGEITAHNETIFQYRKIDW